MVPQMVMVPSMMKMVSVMVPQAVVMVVVMRMRMVGMVRAGMVVSEANDVHG